MKTRAGLVGTGHAVALAASLAVGLVAAPASAEDEPLRRGDRLVYPEGSAIPRNLTPVERRFLGDHPLAPPRTDGPPTGPIHCVAEYEPMEGILIAWESFYSILRELALNVTTIGDGEVYVVVDSGSEQSSAYSPIEAKYYKYELVATDDTYTLAAEGIGDMAGDGWMIEHDQDMVNVMNACN